VFVDQRLPLQLRPLRRREYAPAST
jgi:hypothetical protein